MNYDVHLFTRTCTVVILLFLGFCDINGVHLSHTCNIPELLVSLLPNNPAGNSNHPSFIPSCPETQWEEKVVSLAGC
jgi:hypothetical protein